MTILYTDTPKLEVIFLHQSIRTLHKKTTQPFCGAEQLVNKKKRKLPTFWFYYRNVFYAWVDYKRKNFCTTLSADFLKNKTQTFLKLIRLKFAC
jgi:hypothetical protein